MSRTGQALLIAAENSQRTFLHVFTACTIDPAGHIYMYMYLSLTGFQYVCRYLRTIKVLFQYRLFQRKVAVDSSVIILSNQ